MSKNTYHDLHITTEKIVRTPLCDLPFGVIVTCTRAGGWELWCKPIEGAEEFLAGEFSASGLRLDVGGCVIFDSLTPRDQS